MSFGRKKIDRMYNVSTLGREKTCCLYFYHQNNSNKNTAPPPQINPQNHLVTLKPVLFILPGSPLKCSGNINPFHKLVLLTRPQAEPHRPGPSLLSPRAWPAAAEGAPWWLFCVVPVHALLVWWSLLFLDYIYLNNKDFSFHAKANFSPAFPRNYPYPGSCLWLSNAFPLGSYYK